MELIAWPEMGATFSGIDSAKDPDAYEALVSWLDTQADCTPDPSTTVEHNEWEPEGPEPTREGDRW